MENNCRVELTVDSHNPEFPSGAHEVYVLEPGTDWPFSKLRAEKALVFVVTGPGGNSWETEVELTPDALDDYLSIEGEVCEMLETLNSVEPSNPTPRESEI